MALISKWLSTVADKTFGGFDLFLEKYPFPQAHKVLYVFFIKFYIYHIAVYQRGAAPQERQRKTDYFAFLSGNWGL